MAWHVYIVRCADGTLYTGIAVDVVRRVAEHNGVGRLGARYTRARRPVVLVYQEPATNRSEAGRREYEIKRLRREEKARLIAGRNRNAAPPG
jgi:putative endonuclease